jgi:molecular chaperone DnaK (HSP70)
MGAATKGGVKILINDGSNRETGTYVGYGPKQRFIGETGQAQKVSNFKNTVNFFNRFLGLSTNSPTFQDEAHFVTVPFVPNQEKIEF